MCKEFRTSVHLCTCNKINNPFIAGLFKYTENTNKTFFLTIRNTAHQLYKIKLPLSTFIDFCVFLITSTFFLYLSAIYKQ